MLVWGQRDKLLRPARLSTSRLHCLPLVLADCSHCSSEQRQISPASFPRSLLGKANSLPSPRAPRCRGGSHQRPRVPVTHGSTLREQGPGCHGEQEMGRQDCAWRRCCMSDAPFGPKSHFIEVRSKKSR